MTQLLTNSRQDAFKICRKRHWFAYELGLRKELDAKALRMGSNYHEALELLAQKESTGVACNRLYDIYRQCPEPLDLYDWQIEQETLVRLVCGYFWRWQDDGLTYLATEQTFRLPLFNPATGKSTPVFELAGKIDGIVELEDRRQAVVEHKLISEGLDSDSTLWRRLRIDHQITLYMLAARRLHYPVDTVLYDVTRKPTIKPCNVPLVDDDGLKIVLDSDGQRVLLKNGKPRQTADTKAGYSIQTRPMTVEEWGEKLRQDIGDRPDFYYARTEVPRLDQDLEQYQYELWDIQQTLRQAQRLDRWYRTCNRDTCGWCPYFDLCCNGYQKGEPLPEGFIQLTNVHPELGEINDDNCQETTTAPACQSTTGSQD